MKIHQIVMHLNVRIYVWKLITRAPCRGSGEANPRVGRKRNPATKNARRFSKEAHAVPCPCASGGKGGWFGGAGPECRPKNTQYGCNRVGGSYPGPTTVRRVPPNTSCIAPRRLYLALRPTGGRWSAPRLIVGGTPKRRLE